MWGKQQNDNHIIFFKGTTSCNLSTALKHTNTKSVSKNASTSGQAHETRRVCCWCQIEFIACNIVNTLNFPYTYLRPVLSNPHSWAVFPPTESFGQRLGSLTLWVVQDNFLVLFNQLLADHTACFSTTATRLTTFTPVTYVPPGISVIGALNNLKQNLYIISEYEVRVTLNQSDLAIQYLSFVH